MTVDTRELTLAATPSRYDGMTIALHWATAALVVAQFASAHIWEQLQRGTPWRLGLISTHAAFGILLAAVLILRIVWRSMQRGRLPPVVTGLQHLAASAVHLLLYGLLILQVTLGFVLGWSAGQPLRFFTLFAIPPMIVLPPELRHTAGALHDDTAWVIIAVAGFHAAAALMHHYVFRDDVLRRMMSGAPRRR